MSSEEEESDTVFDDTTDTNIAKIVVCHLSKAEQKQMRGITGNKPKCEDCKTNFAHKKVEVTLKNDAGKVTLIDILVVLFVIDIILKKMR